MHLEMLKKKKKKKKKTIRTFDASRRSEPNDAASHPRISESSKYSVFNDLFGEYYYIAFSPKSTLTKIPYSFFD
jgi:hypothetical protein